MADKKVLSVIATTADRLSDLVISNGQLVFVQDVHKIAFDFNDTRVFYNQIIELNSESIRASMESPINGAYYFVLDTAILWTYQDGKWIQITTAPEGSVQIGTELPESGSNGMLYVNSSARELYVWDEDTQDYILVADALDEASEDDISALFDGEDVGEVSELFEYASDDDIATLFEGDDTGEVAELFEYASNDDITNLFE